MLCAAGVVHLSWYEFTMSPRLIWVKAQPRWRARSRVTDEVGVMVARRRGQPAAAIMIYVRGEYMLSNLYNIRAANSAVLCTRGASMQARARVRRQLVATGARRTRRSIDRRMFEQPAARLCVLR